jgi:four helix bundle protein
MKIDRFEDIEVWRAAREFVGNIYKTLDESSFKKDYSLMDQIKRASVSIMANIAEGFSRNSNKEFIRFLFIAKSSAAEVQSHLYVALDIGSLSKDRFDLLYDKLDKIQRQISDFIKYLKTRPTR